MVILGSGCIGLVTMMACRAMGAGKIIVSDLFSKRLDKALELGADAVINAKEESVEDRVMELTDGVGRTWCLKRRGTPIPLPRRQHWFAGAAWLSWWATSTERLPIDSWT